MLRETRRIFISYRRSDTQGYAGWLNQILEEQFGRSNVFRDHDSIAPGEHFPTKLSRTITTFTDVFVLIGGAWLGTGSGGSRLFDPDDWVRLELEAAIQHGLRIVPLLMGNARLPHRDSLPPSLHPLCDRQSFELRDAHFAEDVRHVVSQTEQVSAAEFQYLGSAAAHRDHRFVELSRLWGERVKRPHAHHLRPQIDALIDLLEPDESVADMALGTVWDDAGQDNSLRATLRDMRDTTFSGIIALTPRRLIYVPRRLESVPTRIVWYRDIINVKSTFWFPINLVLAHYTVTVSVGAGDSKNLIDYITNRLDR